MNLASCRADTSSVCGDPVTFPVPFISRPMNHRREIRAAELSKNGTPHARPRCVNVLLTMIRAPDPTAEPGPLLEVDGQMPRSVQIFHCLPLMPTCIMQIELIAPGVSASLNLVGFLRFMASRFRPRQSGGIWELVCTKKPFCISA